MAPDRLDAHVAFVGGGAYTVNAVRSWAQAVAVRAGHVVAVGSDSDIKPLIGTRTEVIGLDGRMLLRRSRMPTCMHRRQGSTGSAATFLRATAGRITFT